MTKNYYQSVQKFPRLYNTSSSLNELNRNKTKQILKVVKFGLRMTRTN